jgi:hypothetical protein
MNKSQSAKRAGEKRFQELSLTMDPDDLAHVDQSSNPVLLKLVRGADGALQAIESSGLHLEGLTPVRLFPLTDPHHWIVLVDRQGREVVTIADPERLDQLSAQLLQEELKTREFVPQVDRILWVSGTSEPSQWRVSTDRGITEFVLNDEKDIRRLGAHGVLIVDAHGIRYLIPDDRNLDRHSRRTIEWYIT